MTARPASRGRRVREVARPPSLVLLDANVIFDMLLFRVSRAHARSPRSSVGNVGVGPPRCSSLDALADFRGRMRSVIVPNDES